MFLFFFFFIFILKFVFVWNEAFDGVFVVYLLLGDS